MYRTGRRYRLCPRRHLSGKSYWIQHCLLSDNRSMQEPSWMDFYMRLLRFSEVHKLRFWNCSLPEYIQQLRLRRRRSSLLSQPAGSSSADMDFQQSSLHSCQMCFHFHFPISDQGYPVSWKLKAVQLNRHMPMYQFPWHHQISGTVRP